MVDYFVCDVDIKKIQKEQLDILKEFDRICKVYNIRYQLMAGTLLGSVRHKGFIPWDDDIDVCLLREDYERFLEVSKKELNSGYFLQSYKTDESYIMQFSKIRKNNTVFLEKSMSDLDIHHGIYIDVFPLDNVMPNTIKGRFQQKLLYLLGRLNLTRSKSICTNTSNSLSKNTRLLVHYILKIVPKSWTDNLQEKVVTIFKDVDTKYVSHLTNGASKERYFKFLRKKAEFYDIIYGEFEGYQAPIPKKYDEILTKMYGEYMKLPEVEDREPHHGIIEIKL